MRGKSMILIVIALGCGLVASIGISKILDRQGDGKQQTPTRKIYVTVENVDIAKTITAEMVKLEEWPADRVPEGAIEQLEEVVGLAPIQRLYPGEVIRKEKLVSEDMAAGRSRLIPEGYRVKAIKVQSDSAVGNIITPGDHVDILVYLRKSPNVPQATVKTVLEDVRVFAVNASTEKSVDADGQVINAKTVSLLLKPDQVQTMLLATQLGSISLSLRHPDDETETIASNGAGLHSLLNGITETGTPRDETPAADPSAAAARSDFSNFLKELSAPKQETAVATEVLADSEFLVQVLDPNGITTYGLVNDHQISQAQIKDNANVQGTPVAPTVTDPAPFVDPDNSTEIDADADFSAADDTSSAGSDDSTADTDNDA